MTDQGSVYLIGAGPGDPGLITVKAVSILKQADVVLYDFLAHPSLLAYCRLDCEKICVGKKKGFHVKTQDHINELLLTYTQQYKTVVRLKGGDPLIFGRGGEEMLFLKKHDIHVEIVPGVSSTTAVPALAGIPLTHRELSRTVAFVTAHTNTPDEKIILPDADTLVFLMGLSRLDDIIATLLKSEKWTPETPIAVIYKGSTANQKTLQGTLVTIQQHPDLSSIGSPTLIVVGNVCTLKDELEWKNQLPLHGKRIVLLRQSSQAFQWHERLLQLGAESVVFPLINTVALPIQTPLTASFLKTITTLIFTSENAVQYLFKHLFEQKLDARVLHHIKFYVIGKKTRQSLESFGILADVSATDSRSEGILSLFDNQELSKQHILIPQASGARDVLHQSLRDKGASVTQIPLYKTEPVYGDYFPIEDGDIVLFTSSSTAHYFFKHPLYQNQRITACCLGPVTENTVRLYQTERVVVSDQANWESLENLLLSR